MIADQTFAEIEQARSSWRDVHNLLINGKYDVIGDRPAIGGQSVQSFSKLADLVFEGLLALRTPDSHSAQASAIASKAVAIQQAAQSFSEQAKRLSNTLRSVWLEGMSFKDMNGNFAIEVIQSDGTAITNFDTSGNFQSMDAALGQLTTNLGLLVPLFRAEAVGDLSERATALGELVREMEVLRDQV